ncbi:ATP-binding cassette domain-containing protein [Streptomyces nodosus]
MGVHGLLGPNGAGKTTLLRTLATVAPPLEGTLEICGRRVHSERSARAARPMIGYLPPGIRLLPVLLGLRLRQIQRMAARGP